MDAMIEMQLIIEVELMKSELISSAELRQLERKHFQWVQLYGLKKRKREWEIVFNVPSTMGVGTPIKLPRKIFPYLQKLNQLNEAEQSNQISKSEPAKSGHCQQCNFEWRSFAVIGDSKG